MVPQSGKTVSHISEDLPECFSEMQSRDFMHLNAVYLGIVTAELSLRAAFGEHCRFAALSVLVMGESLQAPHIVGCQAMFAERQWC